MEGVMWVPTHSCKLFPWLLSTADSYTFEHLRKYITDTNKIEPCFAREVNGAFEILDGRTRVAIAQGLGIGIIPVIVRQFTDEDAKMFVIDRVLDERKLNRLKRSEIAEIVTTYTKIMKVRTSLNLSRLNYKGDNLGRLDTVKQCSEKLEMSSRTVSRYLRVSKLIDEWKESLDYGSISLRVAVELSYLSEQDQRDLWNRVYPAISITGKDVELFKELKTRI